jgi:hypothetical protein
VGCKCRVVQWESDVSEEHIDSILIVAAEGCGKLSSASYAASHRSASQGYGWLVRADSE